MALSVKGDPGGHTFAGLQRLASFRKLQIAGHDALYDIPQLVVQDGDSILYFATTGFADSGSGEREAEIAEAFFTS